jgi:membrane protease YdiL (CAAX protease family)
VGGLEERPYRSPGRLAGWLALVGSLAALNYYGNLAVDAGPPEDFVYRWSSAIGGLVQFGIMLAIVLALTAGTPRRELLGLRRPRAWGAAAGLSFALVVGTYVLLGLTSRFLDPGAEQGLVPDFWDAARLPQFLANFLVIAVFVPFVEELTFRGAGYGLMAPWGTTLAAVATGVLFALAHGLVEALPIFTVFGIGLGLLRGRTGSVYPCVIVHGVFNGAALIAAVALAGRELG